jgi:hypothetical protein
MSWAQMKENVGDIRYNVFEWIILVQGSNRMWLACAPSNGPSASIDGGEFIEKLSEY